MKMQRIAIALTVVNLLIMTILLAKMHPSNAQEQQQNVLPVLRGRALEIVDPAGRVRASITLQPPVEVDGKKYPESVLLRLMEGRGKPVVKLGAGDNGGGLTLVNQSDQGVLIHGQNESSFIKISHNGKERIIEP